MVVYQAYGLQIGIEQCGAKELESAFLKVSGKDIGELVPGNPFAVEMLLIDEGMAVGVFPQVGVETAEFLSYLDEAPSIANDGFYLSPRFYHTGIYHCLVHVLCGEEGNLFVVETSKAGTENVGADRKTSGLYPA